MHKPINPPLPITLTPSLSLVTQCYTQHPSNLQRNLINTSS